MKILFITNMYPGRNKQFLYSGVFVKEQVKSLRRHKEINSEIHIIDGHLGKKNYLTSAFELAKKIKHGNYDIIHAHYGLSALFVLTNPFKMWKNVLVTLHGGDILSTQGKWLQVFLTKSILKRVSGVIVLNDEMKSIASKINPNIRIIPCGVNTDFFDPGLSQSRSNRILFAGSPSRWVKNHALFNEIIEQYKIKYGAVEVVALDGFSREEIRDLLCSSSALVMTSHSEGSPQIIKEALSCDIAVVSTDVGDVKSVLGGTPGTAIFNSNNSINEASELIHATILTASKSIGARRSRIFQIGLNEETIADHLEGFYREHL